MTTSTVIIPSDNRAYKLIDTFNDTAFVQDHTPNYPATATWTQISALDEKMQCNAAGYVAPIGGASTVTDAYASSIPFFDGINIYTESTQQAGDHLKIYSHMSDNTTKPNASGFGGYEIRLRNDSNTMKSRVRSANGAGGYTTMTATDAVEEAAHGTLDPATVTKIPLLVNITGTTLTMTANGVSRQWDLTSETDHTANTIWGWMLNTTGPTKLYNIRVW